MRAIVVNEWTEPGALRVSEAELPDAGPGTIRVDVQSAGCNFFDVLIVQGKYQVRPPFPFTPGAEIAGVVTTVGEGVDGFSPGDRVLAAVPNGAFAEKAVVPAIAARKLPEGMSFDEGAAFPIVYPTSYAGLVDRAALRTGETLLVHAAAGGVGIAAVQIGKALGARVIATAGGADKLEIARKAGADVVVDYRADDFVERVKQETGGRGADVIYDSVGGDVFEKSLKCIAWAGRLLVIGFASGQIPEVRANRILLKNIAVTGLHWGAYVMNQPDRIPEIYDALFTLFREGKIRPMIFGTYSLDQVPEALEALASRKTWGKVIIRPGE